MTTIGDLSESTKLIMVRIRIRGQSFNMQRWFNTPNSGGRARMASSIEKDFCESPASIREIGC